MLMLMLMLVVLLMMLRLWLLFLFDDSVPLWLLASGFWLLLRLLNRNTPNRPDVDARIAFGQDQLQLVRLQVRLPLEHRVQVPGYCYKIFLSFLCILRTFCLELDVDVE
ncbi:GL19816 [Drosophila persimilis]|uniref:GL19816 n=1 Tax=Drosophila persimilis TaxID=7234 RepID=B4GYE5_DROPE|nr:GL19816 [Drosophila persimilis]